MELKKEGYPHSINMSPLAGLRGYKSSIKLITNLLFISKDSKGYFQPLIRIINWFYTKIVF